MAKRKPKKAKRELKLKPRRDGLAEPIKAKDNFKNSSSLSKFMQLKKQAQAGDFERRNLEKQQNIISNQTQHLEKSHVEQNDIKNKQNKGVDNPLELQPIFQKTVGKTKLRRRQFLKDRKLFKKTKNKDNREVLKQDNVRFGERVEQPLKIMGKRKINVKSLNSASQRGVTKVSAKRVDAELIRDKAIQNYRDKNKLSNGKQQSPRATMSSLKQIMKHGAYTQMNG